MQITSTDTPDLEYFSDEAIDYRSGDKVRVTGGPFKGAEGYIKRIRGNRRLVVALEGIIAVATTYIPDVSWKNARKLTFAPRTMKVAR